jgi:hypothetical protein
MKLQGMSGTLTKTARKYSDGATTHGGDIQ